MKQRNIVLAYNTIESISSQKVPISIAHRLWLVKKAIEPHWIFQRDKEQEVIASFNPTVDEFGNVSFKDAETESKCKEEYARVTKELSDLEVDMSDFKKAKIYYSDELPLSIKDIDALSDFVEFIE